MLVTLLLHLTPLLQPASSATSLIKLPSSDIVHASSGLILQYINKHTPADRIASFTMSIPLSTDTCYLLPPNAIRNIPDCDLSTSNFSQRPVPCVKRFVTGIVAIGIGSAALALSTANSLQLLKLNNEVKTLTHPLVTLDTFASFHTAQLLHLNQGQLQLVLVLNHTQDALNQTINLANQHSATL